MASILNALPAILLLGVETPAPEHAHLPVIERGRLLGQATRVFRKSYNKFIVFAENATAV